MAATSGLASVPAPEPKWSRCSTSLELAKRVTCKSCPAVLVPLHKLSSQELHATEATIQHACISDGEIPNTVGCQRPVAVAGGCSAAPCKKNSLGIWRTHPQFVATPTWVSCQLSGICNVEKSAGICERFAAFTHAAHACHPSDTSSSDAGTKGYECLLILEEMLASDQEEPSVLS